MKKKTDSQILFPEVEVEGYKIKPWTLGKIEKLAPVFERITLNLSTRGIKVADIDLKKIEGEIPGIVLGILPEVAEVLSVTLGVDIEKVREFEIDRVIIFILAIASQNLKYLKNSLSPISEMIKTMTAG